MVSSSSPRNWRFNVFTSFHGPDVRQGFLSHLHKQFNYNGITMFNDQEMERGHIISPTLIEAIRDSRIAIVLLSKNYASSSWCLDELLEIFECKEKIEQTVMTIFYGVDPSDVRHQTGDFGMAFNDTCDRKTEEHRRKWREALTYVGNIAGEDFKNWDNEANMIEKIASDVSDKLNATHSWEFDGMVGLEDHLRKMESLLDLDYDGVKMIGISGPAGIGKSTIVRAFHSRPCCKFQHNCFVDNLWENYKNFGLGSHGLKLRLHKQLLSELLNKNGMQVKNLGVIKERLHDKKVLIILDDVESLDQLKALANIEWFGPGSRIIVTTENKELLQQHGISDIYDVDFPSKSEALMMFCLSAFKQTFPPNEFIDLANEVSSICGNLPLGLHVLGSSLQGKSKDDWIDELPRLKDCLDGRIESVLKVGYETLNEKDQPLFLHIAIFFNYKHVDYVTSMFAKSNVNVRPGLKVIANKNLIHIDCEKRVVMHRLLQVMARQVISKQQPSQRQILVDANEICNVLEFAPGNRSIVGVSFDVAEIDELMINEKAFERLCNLFFLKVYDGRRRFIAFDCNERIPPRELHVREEMEFPRRIQLFHWDAYPGKSLHRFCPENLVELNMPENQLEKLWEGRQPLANLKKMNLCKSSRLKELPDLSNATYLEELIVYKCTALVELPSSIVNLHKIHSLHIWDCKSLEVIPTLSNLTSLVEMNMDRCSQLRSCPDISTNIRSLYVSDTRVEELPASLTHCSTLRIVEMTSNKCLKTFLTHLPTSVTRLDLSDCGIERISDCIEGLYNLESLYIRRCKRLVSLSRLPGSLKDLRACDCESLERVSDCLDTPNAELDFTNCLKLDRQAHRTIVQQLFVCGRGSGFLPGKEVPAEFDHRARGNSLTIPYSTFNRFKVCIVVSYKRDHIASIYDVGLWISTILYRCKVNDNSVKYSCDMDFFSKTENIFLLKGTKHLLIFVYRLPFFDPSEVSTKIVLKFKSREKDFVIIECGVQILSNETVGSNNGGCGDEDEMWYRHESEEEDEDDSIAYETSESESNEALDEQKEDDDIIVNGISESEYGNASDKEDNEEGYKSEYGEASEDKDKDIADEGDYKFISRKRPIKTLISHLFPIFFITVFVFYMVLFCL